ncbi:MAG: DNA replication and repair protein RecF [bacterium]|nr:MAG: DNA replication and repair protein RecF [bacterium]
MVNNIHLTNFRNFDKRTIEFGEGINVINAPNAQGKTNILEAIFFLSTGKSFKAKVESDAINYDYDIARIKGNDLEIVLTRGLIDIGKPIKEKVAKKKLMVNGVPKRLIDFAGNIKVTLFSPQDLDLVTGSPSLRRNFLDMVLSQSDREYRRAIGSYEKGVRQRNKLLWKIREEGLSRSHLLFWNQLLIKNGNYITKRRLELIEFINSLKKCHLEYDSSVISEGRLEQYKNEEVASATTLVGPHRDDFVFLQKKRDLASYGSRGQQRMQVLYLKIAELKYIEEKTSVKPILLLDDIFSELDHKHREIVMNSFNNHQVIITSADEHNLPNVNLSSIKIINLEYA